MSTCIGLHGEYSEHDLPGTKFSEFDCNRCYAFDEDAAMAEIVRLRAKVARAEALADNLDKGAEWNECSVAERMERWPDDNSHRVSRPSASLRARTLLRAALAEPTEPQ